MDLTEATDDGAVFTDCTFRDCRFNLVAAHRRRLPELHVHRLLVLPGRVHRLQVRRQPFERCTFDLLAVGGGDWSFVVLPGADLPRATFTGTGCARPT